MCFKGRMFAEHAQNPEWNVSAPENQQQNKTNYKTATTPNTQTNGTKRNPRMNPHI